ncbi:NnrS family protein [Alsobacter sp. SYSU M60028]|uniref:NnrS family protein n=1 Tax=Alsobacter ponti TaxID=2962936 RepID=A0ABT1L991_9HYPH|nr:NnrS family protein [Alsobacter ponti]MCP8938056.1 NnrS family protein [Alsobacter ponti]
MAAIPRTRPHAGPDILSYGFRPFFLLASLFAGAAILVWLPAFFGEIEIPTAFNPRDWHVHEMLYGFLPAVVTGFLLTAIPNWTGRLPLQGRPLLLLVLAWSAGRLAVFASAWIGAGVAAAVDLSFLALVLAAAGREIVAGRNWRNLRVLAIVSVMLVGNAVFHWEAAWHSAAEYGVRIGLAGALLLIILVGGRVVPSFTRNWLARENPGRMPVAFNRLDAAALIVAGVALLAWIVAPEAAATGVLLSVAAILQAVRLARWAGDRTWRDRLVLILHVAYAFIPLGFALEAAAAFGVVPASAGIHAWTAGAFGSMTLAIMSRASLGHTGRALVASLPVQIVYGLLVLGAVARVCAALRPDWSVALLHVAALSWSAAFLGFAGAYWKVFTGPRIGR